VKVLPASVTHRYAGTVPVALATNTSDPFTYVPPVGVVTAVGSTSANAGAGLITLAVPPKTAGNVLVAYAQMRVDLVNC
jgi:hypothetical protein